MSQFDSERKTLLKMYLEIRHLNYVCSLGMGINTSVVRILGKLQSLQ